MKISLELNGVVLLTVVIAAMSTSSPKIQPFSNLESHFTVGDKVTLVCALKSGTAPFSFLWLKNGQPISDDFNTVVLQQLSDFSSLIIKSLDLSSKGNYSCKVTNDFGADSYSGYLNVVVPPKWISVPKDIQILFGESAQLKCVADGSPSPAVTWEILKKGSSERKLESKIQEDERGSLKIDSATEQDGGSYVCKASNGIGEALSHAVEVRVLGMSKNGSPRNIDSKFIIEDYQV